MMWSAPEVETFVARVAADLLARRTAADGGEVSARFGWWFGETWACVAGPRLDPATILRRPDLAYAADRGIRMIALASSGGKLACQGGRHVWPSSGTPWDAARLEAVAPSGDGPEPVVEQPLDEAIAAMVLAHADALLWDLASAVANVGVALGEGSRRSEGKARMLQSSRLIADAARRMARAGGTPDADVGWSLAEAKRHLQRTRDDLPLTDAHRTWADLAATAVTVVFELSSGQARTRDVDRWPNPPHLVSCLVERARP